MYRLNKETPINGVLIKALVDDFKVSRMSRLQRLGRYYKGEHDILGRVIDDPAKPNNKIVNPYPKYITDIATGYFMGSPVKYSSDDSFLLEKVQPILDRNSDSTHNMELAKQVSIYGVAYELVYLEQSDKPDTVSEIKYDLLEPENTFIVYDNSINAKPLFAVRFYSEQDYITKEMTEVYEVYTPNEVQLYSQGKDTLELVESLPHYFGGVPVVEYKNNAEELGDFEAILSLVDAYDMAVSDTANDINYFSDAYMKLTGMELIDPNQLPLAEGQTPQEAFIELTEEYPDTKFVTAQDLSAMKQNRVLILPEGSGADYLIKSADYQSIEVYKTRLREDIHKFSMTPDLTDTSFASNASGVAMKYKVFGLENIAVNKENMFKGSLQKRMKLITHLLNVRGGNHDSDQVYFTFSRNLPQDNEAVIKMSKELLGLVSHETALSILPSNIVDDVAYEMEQLKQEKTDPSSMYGNLSQE